MNAIPEINVDLVRWRLNLAQARAAIASANIANVHTDGYVAQRLNFADQLSHLRQAFETGDAAAALRHVRAEGLTPETYQPRNILGASVNLDHEIVELVDASTQYRALTTMLNRHFGLMRLALTSGG